MGENPLVGEPEKNLPAIDDHLGLGGHRHSLPPLQAQRRLDLIPLFRRQKEEFVEAGNEPPDARLPAALLPLGEFVGEIPPRFGAELFNHTRDQRGAEMVEWIGLFALGGLLIRRDRLHADENIEEFGHPIDEVTGVVHRDPAGSLAGMDHLADLERRFLDRLAAGSGNSLP